MTEKPSVSISQDATQRLLAIIAKKKKEAIKLLPKFNSQMMKIAKKGIIKKKTVSRKISRLTKKINKL